jgi:hypothetical protein
MPRVRESKSPFHRVVIATCWVLVCLALEGVYWSGGMKVIISGHGDTVPLRGLAIFFLPPLILFWTWYGIDSWKRLRGIGKVV